MSLKSEIVLNNIKKSYHKTMAVSDVSLNLEKNEIYGLIGPDGAGKTTLIRIVCTLLKPDSGTVQIKEMQPQKELKKIRSILGYMPQKFSLYQDLTVEQNLLFYANLFNVDKKSMNAKIEEMYQFSGLKQFASRKAGALSGGMKQKLALSCNLIHLPQVLILDEPTFGVDPVSRLEFWEMLFRIKASGISILVSTAYMDEAEKCDRISLMHKGQFIATGTPLEIIDTYPYSLFRVTGDTKKLKDYFGDLTNVHHQSLFGHNLHVSFISSPDEEELKRIISNCSAIESMEEIRPSIEDVFLEKMG
ncbi:MAG: ABC transporter ATP-binding protein [Candidatus Cloacimonetes bacterium]|nr:ABC transporter ATP-binding protein [Candidatus Cloacimonadota bacterium]